MPLKTVTFRQITHLKYWQSNLVASATHCWLRASNPSREHARKKYQGMRNVRASTDKLPLTLSNSWLQLRLKLQTLFKLHSSKCSQDLETSNTTFLNMVCQAIFRQVARRHFVLHFIPDSFGANYSSSLRTVITHCPQSGSCIDHPGNPKLRGKKGHLCSFLTWTESLGIGWKKPIFSFNFENV